MLPVPDERRTHGAPVASRTLLAACCIVFLWQVFEVPWGRLASLALGFTPAWFLAGGPPNPFLAWVPFSVTIISCMFLHAGWLHIAGNMLFLWVFGDDVEDAMGHPGFIVFYLTAGMVAALAHALADTSSVAPLVGASGAVSGVVGAYLALYPRATVSLLVPVFLGLRVIRLPAFVVLAGWFLVQVVYDVVGPALAGGIAFRAHIGGFVFGVLMAPLFARISRAAGPRPWRRVRPG